MLRCPPSERPLRRAGSGLGLHAHTAWQVACLAVCTLLCSLLYVGELLWRKPEIWCDYSVLLYLCSEYGSPSEGRRLFLLLHPLRSASGLPEFSEFICILVFALHEFCFSFLCASFCFSYFETVLLGVYKFRVVPFWWMGSSVICSNVVYLKVQFSDINLAVSADFALS